MWCVGELKLPYVRHDIGHTYGGNATPEFLAMNPNGTVPVLRDGAGDPLWETGAILRYLCNRYGSEPFWPKDPAARARVDMWAEWAKINVSLNFTAPIFWRAVRTGPQNIDRPAIQKAVSDLAKKLDIAEVRLAKASFISGDAFTLADIQLGHVLYRYFDIAIERPDHPALRRYYDKLATRPAFREHVMVPYEELRVTD
jgi:glutathione S-transferase